ncbi:MAG: holo-[acyl-carrier-protein] synthase [Candidatus Brocadia sp.]|jgi:phosphopantethiene--protein transferase domain|uniref:Holo-[acyl-carrier-protein] synthase n=1 Tax=Candidatus Brocadia fulgida TaxID=380242 RepID=A0A0M2UZD3_9BACT|nr:MAG: putative holo-(acyl-carrier protein) synthase [Candidatus Brocadia fulgida]MCC6325154.1 holo-ACP synthase [Candidatus Brocadia sp.]MCE7910624.1 holo-[acyl-carrier-protein] synthase [Candidatus Brocadia sp. AMX3]MBV6518983.1 Holo-[acyl-carrier-protein] synthase [Candidatus Brocadia fulgida]MDG5996083.1 holo-[acyl-carrier-protein] synthase [Candidatus Brocadia sp.]
MYVGIDIVEIRRIEKLFSANEDFLRRIYTEKEVEYCNQKKNKYQHFAARFASKEAMFKALGTGWADKMKWTDIELLNDKKGRPYLNLYGRVKELADEKRIGDISVSLSHCHDYAIAQVLLVPKKEDCS